MRDFDGTDTAMTMVEVRTAGGKLRRRLLLPIIVKYLLSLLINAKCSIVYIFNFPTYFWDKYTIIFRILYYIQYNVIFTYLSQYYCIRNDSRFES